MSLFHTTFSISVLHPRWFSQLRKNEKQRNKAASFIAKIQQATLLV